jgi:hypothetical protein
MIVESADEPMRRQVHGFMPPFDSVAPRIPPHVLQMVMLLAIRSISNDDDNDDENHNENHNERTGACKTDSRPQPHEQLRQQQPQRRRVGQTVLLRRMR